jgi:sugar phosphate isomerase/epimerase
LGHSSRADRDQAESDLRDILVGVLGQLEENKITLSLENYPEKNRVPSGILDMYNFMSNLPPVYQIAFDTSHTIGNTDSVIEDIARNVGKIALFHFSNRCRDERHMPIFSSKGELNFSKIIDAIRSSRFNGMIILEYQPKRYRMLLERDLKMLRDAIYQT